MHEGQINANSTRLAYPHIPLVRRLVLVALLQELIRGKDVLISKVVSHTNILAIGLLNVHLRTS